MEERKKVKTAICGCGMISNIYIKNLKNLFEIIDLTALCNRSRDKAEKQAQLYGVDRVMTVEEMLADPEIELVVNLTGPAAHYDVIRRALLAGKNVYTEKVLALDMEEARELARLADEKGLYLCVAPDTFLGGGLQTARKLLDAGMIGQVTSAVASINRNHRLNSEVFGFLREKGGGFAYDVGIYYVTALLSLLGPVDYLAGFSKSAQEYEGQMYHLGNYGKTWNFADDNLTVGSVHFASGVLGSLHFNGETMSDEHSRLEIYGTEGALILGNPNGFDGPVKLIRNLTGSCEIPLTHGYAGFPVYPDGEDFVWKGYGYRGIGVAEMAWAMRKGRRPRADKEMGLHALEVLYGLEQSGKNHSLYEMTSSFQRPVPLPSNKIAAEGGSIIGLEASLA